MKSLIIFYDNYCSKCTRFATIIKKMDWFELIEIKQLRNSNEIDQFKNFNLEMSKEKMASSIDNKWYYGYNSIFLIFCKLPVFWIFIPFLYILKITKIGELLYSEFAIKRKIVPINCGQDNCSIIDKRIE